MKFVNYVTSTSKFTFLIVCVSFLRLIIGDELFLDKNCVKIFYKYAYGIYWEDKYVTNEEIWSAIKDDINEKPEYICRCTRLNVSAVPDKTTHSIEVSFVVSNPLFKDCFENYMVVLEKNKAVDHVEKENKTVDYAHVRYRYDTEKRVSHEFKDVPCGVYNILIRRCRENWECILPDVVDRKPINMTSNVCLGLNASSAVAVVQQFEKKTILITAVTSVLLILAIGGLIYLFYRLSTIYTCIRQMVATQLGCLPSAPKSMSFSLLLECNGERVTINEDESIDILEERSPTRNIDLYILHYYDRNEVNKWKVEIIKDFYLKSGYYNTIRTIENELSIILFDVNDWLNKMCEESAEDGSIRKIILIASEEDNQEDEYELENIIFSEFIDKLNDNIERCRRDYDHLFVAQLISNVNYPEKLENIVRRVRYSLSEELIDDHLINLSLNLCSGSNLNEFDVERNLRELLFEHPVRYLGSVL